MSLSLSLFALFVTGVLAEDPCPANNINNLYKELNCEPVFEIASKCPSSFNCLKFEARNRDHCNYKGVSYAIREHIPEEVSDPCFKQCVCTKYGDKPTFSCALVECPEHWVRPPPENCVSIYSKDECCSTETFCPNATNTRATCEYNGRKYYEGERFYPEGNSCKRCYCKPGFKGELEEPFCESIKCNVELSIDNRLNENCAPVYYGEDGCCPISWKCPSPSVSTRISSNSHENVTTEARCKFGDVELKQHEMFEEDGVRCECRVPPYLTCFGG